MEINIDLAPMMDFMNLPLDIMMLQIFLTVGWIPIAITLLWGFRELWVFYITNKWAGTQKKIMLAVDIPRGNLQSLRAVENLFTYLAGAHKTNNLIETYWDGVFQLSFSFEIVSIDGYTQFLIRTPLAFRNLVETAIYSQYPDAEITEVGDYTAEIPKRFPDEEWDIWGAEFVQARPVVLPFKTYEEFEHQYGEPETTFRDPMATLMDLCSSLRKGEQLWFQIIVKPIDMVDWTKEGDLEVKKILKEEIPKKEDFADVLIKNLLVFIDIFSEAIFSLWGEIEKKEEKKNDPLKMMNLKPNEKKQVESIHLKTSKVGFNTKTRFIYVAKKDVMNKPKVANGFVGYMKQFASLDLNNLKPDMKRTGTSTAYFMKDSRMNRKKNTLMFNYVNRDGSAGNKMGVMTTDELATLWHFPIESVVKAPLIQKAAGKKSEPPSSLPIGQESVNEIFLESIFENDHQGGDKGKSKEKQAEEITDDLFLEDSDKIDSRKNYESGLPDIFKNIEPRKKATPSYQEKKEEELDNKIDRGTPPPNLPFA